eukprot:TRINITY_DN3773_c0_g2_i5.p1 TRINITY_DN3773_c0_g2~~TRINITY_DN3773_c0_g2_i5.p1  ORF type:complete len:299 (+),score=84.44 TRINITY_DN3773_c0_g2_i5:94-897(+)
MENEEEKQEDKQVIDISDTVERKKVAENLDQGKLPKKSLLDIITQQKKIQESPEDRQVIEIADSDDDVEDGSDAVMASGQNSVLQVRSELFLLDPVDIYEEDLLQLMDIKNAVSYENECTSSVHQEPGADLHANSKMVVPPPTPPPSPAPIMKKPTGVPERPSSLIRSSIVGDVKSLLLTNSKCQELSTWEDLDCSNELKQREQVHEANSTVLNPKKRHRNRWDEQLDRGKAKKVKVKHDEGFQQHQKAAFKSCATRIQMTKQRRQQ